MRIYTNFIMAICLVIGRVVCCISDYKSRIRYYCIAAIEESWHYAPNSSDTKWDLSGIYEEYAPFYLNATSSSIGSQYIKALFREYESSNSVCDWNSRKKVELINGLLGPVIRAVVGDTIYVHFKNMANYSYSIHPRGLSYDNENEGESVEPNQLFTYQWSVPESAGPSLDSDISSSVWMYHSNVDPAADVMSGLVGPIIITSRQAVGDEEAATPCNVHSEVVLLATVFDENNSRYIEASARAVGLDYEELRRSEGFVESNKKFSINGYCYGNLSPHLGLQLQQGANTRWYVLAVSYSAEDPQEAQVPSSLVWSGNTLRDGGGAPTDHADLLSPSYVALDMQPYNAGVWLIQGGLLSYSQRGMLATYLVGQPAEGDGDADGTSRQSQSLGRSTLYIAFVLIIVAGVVLLVVMLGGTAHSLQRRTDDHSLICIDDSTRSMDISNDDSHGRGGDVPPPHSQALAGGRNKVLASFTQLASSVGLKISESAMDESERSTKHTAPRSVEI